LEIGEDRKNKIMILTGTGDVFMDRRLDSVRPTVLQSGISTLSRDVLTPFETAAFGPTPTNDSAASTRCGAVS
jgi:hypothetical protein